MPALPSLEKFFLIVKKIFQKSIDIFFRHVYNLFIISIDRYY